jgi:hypothetical protein
LATNVDNASNGPDTRLHHSFFFFFFRLASGGDYYYQRYCHWRGRKSELQQQQPPIVARPSVQIESTSTVAAVTAADLPTADCTHKRSTTEFVE